MQVLPQIAPISDLKHRHLEVFERLKQGPVVLANRSHAVRVLIAPAEWDALAERFTQLEVTVATLEAELARREATAAKRVPDS